MLMPRDRSARAHSRIEDEKRFLNVGVDVFILFLSILEELDREGANFSLASPIKSPDYFRSTTILPLARPVSM